MSAGVAQIAQLISAAADSQEAAAPCIMVSLCSLSAAQALPADSVNSALACGINSSRWLELRPLLELPCAAQISTQCLCAFIKKAADDNNPDLVGLLCK